jgi:hypothetical protein
MEFTLAFEYRRRFLLQEALGLALLGVKMFKNFDFLSVSI